MLKKISEVEDLEKEMEKLLEKELVEAWEELRRGVELMYRYLNYFGGKIGSVVVDDLFITWKLKHLAELVDGYVKGSKKAKKEDKKEEKKEVEKKIKRKGRPRKK